MRPLSRILSVQKPRSTFPLVPTKKRVFIPQAPERLDIELIPHHLQSSGRLYFSWFSCMCKEPQVCRVTSLAWSLSSLEGSAQSHKTRTDRSSMILEAEKKAALFRRTGVCSSRRSQKTAVSAPSSVTLEYSLTIQCHIDQSLLLGPADFSNTQSLPRVHFGAIVKTGHRSLLSEPSSSNIQITSPLGSQFDHSERLDDPSENWQDVSRMFDIWSLGCVLIECAEWATLRLADKSCQASYHSQHAKVEYMVKAHLDRDSRICRTCSRNEVGKTQTAMNLTHTHKEGFYDTILWVSTECNTAPFALLEVRTFTNTDTVQHDTLKPARATLSIMSRSRYRILGTPILRAHLMSMLS